MKYCFGVDIGGTTIKLGLFTDQGELCDHWEIPTRNQEGGKNILSDVAASIQDKVIEKRLQTKEIIGIGMGVPGPVDQVGIVHNCVNLGWGEFHVAKEMESLLGIPVSVGNDANVAALGEAWQGGGKGYDNVVMVTLGTGVGGGIILGGQMIAGTKGAAGEIGHLLVNYNEIDCCNCGKKGCLEQYASATGIVKEAKRLLASSDQTSKLREADSLSAKLIFDYAKEGDSLANELVHELCRYLGIALAHVATVVDPQVFVIGGGVSKAGTVLTELTAKTYNECVMPPLRNREFRLATLGNKAGIYGAAKLALQK